MRLLVTLLTCCLLTFGASAQNDLMDLPRYKGLFIGFGPRFINTDPGTIITNLVDDSPSMDQFSATTEIKDLYVRPGIQIGWKWGNYSKLSHDILFDIAMGKSYHAFFGYSIGWNIDGMLSGKRFVIRPALQGLVGNGLFYLGEIQNNAAFIQFGETQYYDRELGVELRAESAHLAAKVDFTYKILPKIDLFAKLAYDLPTDNNSPRIVLTAPDNPDSRNTGSTSTRLDLDETENLMVTYNGESLSSLPYRIGGLRVTVGASYVWERRKKNR